MIKTYLLFEKVSPALAAEFLDFFYAKQKQAINVAIQTMAVKRKMRPIFVQRMVPQKRYQWLHRELSRRDNSTIAENLLQSWFMETQGPMLCDFMDSLEIPHNDKGEVEDMPATMDEAKLKSGVDALLGKYDAEKVVLYLHTIPALEMANWPSLINLLISDERLRFPGQTEPLATAEDAAAAATASQGAEAAPTGMSAERDVDAAPNDPNVTVGQSAERDVDAAPEDPDTTPKKSVKPAAGSKKASTKKAASDTPAEPATAEEKPKKASSKAKAKAEKATE